MQNGSLYRIFLIIAMVFAMAGAASAANEITQYADQLNYWDVESHTVVVSNSGVDHTEVNITHPSTFTFSTGTGCASASATLITCTVGAGASSSYTVDSPGGSAIEYDLGTFTVSATNNSYTSSTSVQFLRIHPSEVFHTLVEYGRGRGNYFFDSYYKTENVSGSGHSGIGCPFVPNGTLFELNYLHKVLNIGHYMGLTGEGENVSFTCTYPNQTIVRHHLTTDINRSGSIWTADYSIRELESSWERMGYVGQDFDSGEYIPGATITVNCTGLSYQLPSANGNVSVDEDSFTITVRDRHPFNISATAAGTIYNGTQEVEITYTITNIEDYTVNDIAIEIQSPQYGTFIGTRGELWGVSQDRYRYETDEFGPGETQTITLVARFNTSEAPTMAELELSQGVSIEYITCWESNAYNPAEYIQDVGSSAIGNATVDMNTNRNITNVITTLTNIVNILNTINNTVSEINTNVIYMNDTINNIYNLTWWINRSTWNISYNVWNYYSRNLTYYPPTTAGSSIAGGGGTAACRWNETEWFSDAFAESSKLIYGSEILRVDFPDIYNNTVDFWQICHKVAPSAATSTGDDLEIYICNDYNGSSNPHDNNKCILIDVEDPDESKWVADHFKWECDSIINKEVDATNITVILKCDDCSGTADAWQVAIDTGVDLNYTLNSSDSGLNWNNYTGEGLVSWEWCVPIDFGLEVWQYNNRSLTDYNFSWIYQQFDCANGSTTSEMCRLLYGINLTTYNTWQTIQVINITVNAIGSNISIINQNIQNIVTQLNCSGGVDESVICKMLRQMNETIEDIRNITINVNNTVSSINSTLYFMNQTMIQRFDGIDGNLTLIYNINVEIKDLLNCTNITSQFQNSTCNRLNDLSIDILYLNDTVNNIYDLVFYINGSRWLNYTAQDLIDRIENITAETDLSEVLRQIELLKQFDEELVFLVTDAFNLQQQARKAADNGDLDTAAAKLEESKAKLDQATSRLGMLNGAFEAEKDIAMKQSKWWVWVALLAGICVVFVFMFQKVPEETEPRQY